MTHYFDAHTHTHFAAFQADWREVIERALKHNVWLLNVGTQKDTSARAVEVANLYNEGVYAAVGLHPIHTEKSYHDEKELGISDKRHATNNHGFFSREEEFDYDYYKKLALDPKVVAIGECGLDYFRLGEETKERQKSTFIGQIELAAEVKKPLMIHCRSGRPERTSPQNGAGRNAFENLINILKTNHSKLNTYNPGVIHFFTGTEEDAKKLLDLGFSFTFGGVITFARDYDEAIKAIPLDRILTETDAPYVAPVPYRGKRNEPAYVVEVVKKLAEIKNISAEEMADEVFRNTRNVFRLQ